MNHHLLVPLMARGVLSWANLVTMKRPAPW
jgi:hypothetical protein